jgi:hypothetical protein
MIEPLPEELQHLVAAETSAPVISDQARAAVRAKLGATLGIGGAAVAVSTAQVASAKAATAVTTKASVAAATGGVAVKSAIAIKLIVVVVSVGAVATTVAVTRDREPTAPVVERAPRTTTANAPAKQPALRVEPIVEPIVEPVEQPAIPPPQPTPPPRRIKQQATEPPPAEAPPTEAPAPPSQSQLLADASRSLSLGDAAHALELLDEDSKLHSGGPLVEERDALRISALSSLGRTTEARAAARHLLATYPHSIHRPLAERVLAKETP